MQVMFLAAACLGPVVPSVAETAPTEVVSAEQILKEAVRAAVVPRVESRWAALISGDIASAYAIEAPGYRQVVPLETFRSGFGGAAAWQGITVTEVTVSQDGSAAQVRLELTYKPRIPMVGEYPTVTRPVREAWVKREGQWWHVSE